MNKQLQGGSGFFLMLSFVSATIISAEIAQAKIPLVPPTPVTQPLTLAQTVDVIAILRALPTPANLKGRIGDLAAANAYGGKAVNFQTGTLAEPAVAFYQKSLGELGYSEREINRVVGSWGFNLVFDPPKTLVIPAQARDKAVVLVLQGTMLGSDTLNINVRFEEI